MDHHPDRTACFSVTCTAAEQTQALSYPTLPGDLCLVLSNMLFLPFRYHAGIPLRMPAQASHPCSRLKYGSFFMMREWEGCWAFAASNQARASSLSFR